MPRFFKNHSTAVYISAFILCIACLLVLFLYMTSHTQTCAGTDKIEEYTTMINTNLSIWMGVIAAICTLLPLASNFYQAAQADSIKSDTKKKMEEVQNNFRMELDHIKDEYSKIIEETRHKSALVDTLTTISLLHNNVNTIRELQDLQSKETNLTLADEAYLNILTDSISCLSSVNTSFMECEYNDKEYKEIVNSVVNLLNSYRRLLRSLEVVAHGEQLYRTIELQDTIRTEMQSLINFDAQGNDNKKLIRTAAWLISQYSMLCTHLIGDIRKHKGSGAEG